MVLPVHVGSRLQTQGCQSPRGSRGICSTTGQARSLGETGYYSFHCGNDVIGLMQWNKKLCNNVRSSKLDQCSIPKHAGHVHVGVSYSYEQL